VLAKQSWLPMCWLGVLVATSLSGAPPRNPDRVLHPRALAATSPPASVDELRKLFADPPAPYRPAPLWVWNDEQRWADLQHQLQQFRQLGLGGAFVHPRPGLMTEYLSEEWFDLWKRSLEEARRLGLLLHIYDENSYPSGFAGGHVPARDPHTAGKIVTYEFRPDGRSLPWSDPAVVAIYAVQFAGEVPRVVQPVKPGDRWPEGFSALIFRVATVEPSVWTAGFPYVDLTNPRTTELFLESIYEAYWRRFGPEFGKSILWAFSDEPRLSTGRTGSLPISHRTLAEFRRRYGYDLASHLPELIWDIGEFRKIRFDFWEFLHDQLQERFFEPMFLWCDQHNLQWTGHWWEHLWPYPWYTPSHASYYVFEHMPGIDMLALHLANLTRSGQEPHMLFTIREVASVAHQLGRPRVLSESYGTGGWDCDLEFLKRVGDWQLVHGINFINPHLVHSTIRGARKRDWPQSFSDVAAWWPYYRFHADHLARASLMLAAGERRPRLLVLTPTTTGYLYARASGGNTIGELDRLREEFSQLIQFLADRHIDFDLADEYVLEWFGQAGEAQLRVGRATYQLVLWPRGLEILREPTARLLERYLESGGIVVAAGPPARYIDGRPSDRVRQAAQQATGQWLQTRSLDELAAELRRRIPPRVEYDRPTLPGTALAERHLAGGDRILFWNNAGPHTWRAMARTEGRSVEWWDTISGEIRPYQFELDGDRHVRFPVELPPAGSLLLVVRQQPGKPASAPAPEVAYPVATGPWTTEREEPNVLVLDYCDLEVGGEQHTGLNTLKANKLVYQAHGFPQNPWERAVQFRRTIFEQASTGPKDGFRARFQFRARRAALRGLQLAVEAPELYRIEVNGHPVDTSAAVPWLDPHLKRFSIERFAREGLNEVLLAGQPFDVRMELENIYVLGEFVACPIDRGFELDGPRELRWGSWRQHGLPFYGASVVYRTTLHLDRSGQLHVQLGHWKGSLAEVLLDGHRVALLGWPPWLARIPVAAGKHELAIRVCGTPRNLLGPFHDPARRRLVALPPGAWVQLENTPQPPGEQYDLVDYGLFEPPQLELRVPAVQVKPSRD